MSGRRQKEIIMLTELTRGDITICCDTRGGELRSIRKNGLEYLWQGDPAYWAGRAPVLFPIVGCLPSEGLMSAEGLCRMKRHGLARLCEHRCRSTSDFSVTYELTDSEETRCQYPFRFRLNMTYGITGEGGVMTLFTVTNPGTVPLPFAVGGHPAFRVPLTEEEAFEDYELRLTRPCCFSSMRLNAEGLFDPADTVAVFDGRDTLTLSHDLFARDALMLTEVPDNTITLTGLKSGRGVTLTFDGFDYLGLWSAGNAPFAALEPWIAHSSVLGDDDRFEHKTGLVSLPPGKSATWAFVITPF